MAPSKLLIGSIESVPNATRARMREGFGYLSELSPEVRKDLVARVTGTFMSGSNTINLEPLVAATSLKTSQVAAIVTALTATLGIAVQSEASSADFLTASKGKFFDPEDEAVVTSVVNEVVAGRAEARDAFEVRRLANETLPALSSFDVSVDLRLRFEDSRILDGIPVALIHLDTDATGQEIWFQAARAEVEMMLHELQKTLRQMDLAEEFKKQRP
jgi:hypothetical protein